VGSPFQYMVLRDHCVSRPGDEVSAHLLDDRRDFHTRSLSHHIPVNPPKGILQARLRWTGVLLCKPPAQPPPTVLARMASVPPGTCTAVTLALAFRTATRPLSLPRPRMRHKSAPADTARSVPAHSLLLRHRHPPRTKDGGSARKNDCLYAVASAMPRVDYFWRADPDQFSRAPQTPLE